MKQYIKEQKALLKENPADYFFKWLLTLVELPFIAMGFIVVRVIFPKALKDNVLKEKTKVGKRLLEVSKKEHSVHFYFIMSLMRVMPYLCFDVIVWNFFTSGL